MKTVIVALNSKYIHSSLAPWYLKACCGDEFGEIRVLEFTINDSLDSVFSAIYREKADVVAFSCYIWNITQVLRLAEDLKQVSPKTVIILGGPEVSFDAGELMNLNNYIDYIIAGEGEIPFKKIMEYLYKNTEDEPCIPGVYFRKAEAVLFGGPGTMPDDLDIIPSPYTDEMLSANKDKIVYFESSRGCPFSCSYCISSTFEGVRYFSMERVKSDLLRLLNAGVKQVKFVDRTFNCNRSRAKEIFKFIIENRVQDINFHFEAAADLFDDEMIEMLSRAPEGLIQFEIGVQTVNADALRAVGRKTDLEKLFANVRKLSAPCNIHLHLDLIAGLPYENMESFGDSFNWVYSCKPQQLQLGFLKLLKGSRIRQEAELYGYKFRKYPPYEVLGNRFISADELILLKGVEELVERYYNSGRFVRSLDYIISSCFESPFDFFTDFYRYNSEKGLLDKPLSARQLYTVMLDYSKRYEPKLRSEVLNDLLKFDFLSSNNTANLPDGLKRNIEPGFKERCFDFLKDDGNVVKYLPQYASRPPKEIFKKVHFESFDFDVTQDINRVENERQPVVILFDYGTRSKVTGLYRSHRIF